MKIAARTDALKLGMHSTTPAVKNTFYFAHDSIRGSSAGYTYPAFSCVEIVHAMVSDLFSVCAVW